ncbi:ethanolamine ammonia-lyase subunit EutC [Bauldia sp.]|uniref:ethanolamine ammonia-lyase subunit EutC n=1 Tax=Bauldia sp. TaxID=2575872 RepID=UPI003BACDFCF
MTKEKRALDTADPWTKLRRFTPARIALGHAGTSLPTRPHLAFQLAHMRARHAIHQELDIPTLEAALRSRGYETLLLRSRADDRSDYLQRPDKGRRLDLKSREKLERLSRPDTPYDVAFVIGDGLSAVAIEKHAVNFLDAVMPILAEGTWRIAPPCIVKGARVAVGDEIGERLGAGMVVVLIGERPGLSSPDSMGIYMTLKPRIGLTDESRNCISNVRAEGLSYERAADKLAYLMGEARRLGFSGVQLKDDAELAPRLEPKSTRTFLIEPDDR